MQIRLGTIRKAACAAALAAACCAGLVACSGNSNAAPTDPMLNTADTSGGVAATVNGTEIGENAITAYIEVYRSAQGLEEDDAWGEWLIDNGYTIDSIRGDTVEYYVSLELVRQAAQENDVTVSDEEIDEQMQAARDTVDSDEEWESALAEMGMSENVYRWNVELTLLQNALMEKVAADVAASDEEVLSYVQMYAGTYNGAKRSSHILFASGDDATATEVLDKINSGELDFAEAAQQYSTDTSAESGGDVGWDKMSTFVSEYQSALDALEVGQVSGLVTSDYGIHIITCTDLLEAPDEVTSLDQVSSGFVEYLREMVDTSAKQQAYSEYMTEYQDSADIVENSMPEGLSYVIDLAPYEEAAAAAAEETEESESAGTDDAASSDDAGDQAGADDAANQDAE